MGTVQIVDPGVGRRRSAWDGDGYRSELDLPGWQEFTTARDRFFAGLRVLEAAGLREDGSATRAGVNEPTGS